MAAAANPTTLVRGPRFGPHVTRDFVKGGRPSIVEHIKAAQLQASEAGFEMGAAAVFVAGPRDLRITLTPAERKELNEYIRQSQLRVVAHDVYASPIWKGYPASAEFIHAELAVCAEAGIGGLVVHLPNLPVEDVMKQADKLLTDTGVVVYLETPASKASPYNTPEKLDALMERIRELDPNLSQFGVCIDTAHLWVSGVNVQSAKSADSWIERLEASSIPSNRIMMHLNDSKVKIGTGPDKHAALATGMIWGPVKGRLRMSGLASFVDYARRNGTVTILERKPVSALVGDYRLLSTIL